MSFIHNEQTKLSAAWLNGVSLAIFGAGGFGPWITLANPAGPHYDTLILSLIIVVCIFGRYRPTFSPREHISDE